jgi:hypothetical protein
MLRRVPVAEHNLSLFSHCPAVLLQARRAREV